MAKNNPHASASGKKGGKARASRLTAEERRASAKKAADARWKEKDYEPMIAIPEVKNDPVGIEDYQFLIAKSIEDCPPHAVVTELIRNCKEAAEELSPPGKIECFTEEVDDVPKIGFFNEGKGMSGEELKRLTNFSSSGKIIGMGRDQHFGTGGKVAALAASPYGVRYRSCKNGYVSEVILMREYDPKRRIALAVRKRHLLEDGRWEAAIDVTEEYKNRSDRPLNKDWTEVLLLGKEPLHNTRTMLLNNNPCDIRWLIRSINQRFYVLPPGILIRKANIPSENAGGQAARGLEPLMMEWSRRYEDVTITDRSYDLVHKYGPITIRYFHLKEKGDEDHDMKTDKGDSRRNLMTAYGMGKGAHVCLVWNNECYEMACPWGSLASSFGIYAGSVSIAVHIVLQDESPIKNDHHRCYIMEDSQDEKNNRIRIETFSDLVEEHRPEWLKAYIQDQHDKTSKTIDVSKALRAFIKELELDTPKKNLVEGSGDDEGVAHRNGDRRGTHPKENPTRPARGAKQLVDRSIEPTIEWCTDEGVLEGMGNRAGIYDFGKHIVRLNGEHTRYKQMRQTFLEEAGRDEVKQKKYATIFNEEYFIHIGRWVILAWYYRGSGIWGENEWQTALTKEIITINLTSPEIIKKAQNRIRGK